MVWGVFFFFVCSEGDFAVYLLKNIYNCILFFLFLKGGDFSGILYITLIFFG